MEKCKFTPGPWKLSSDYEEYDDPENPIIVLAPRAKSNWRGLKGFWPVCEVGPDLGLDDSPQYIKRTNADSRLIAAAPDLHEALSGLLEQWKEFQASSGNMEEAYYKLAKYAHPHWEKAAAALSKANGESGDAASNQGEGR